MSARSWIERRALKALLGLPGGLHQRMFGAPPRNQRGTALDREVHVMLALEARLKAEFAGGSPAQARAGLQHSVKVVEGPEVPLHDVEDLSVGKLRCRRYRPGQGASARLVYLHGGGWVVGDLRSHDRFCRRLAAEGGVEVWSLDYPLAPEHPFPEAIHAIVEAWEELAAAPGPLALGGDSAGGNLTAAVCIALREAGGRLPDWQVLLYPSTDLEGRSPSRHEFANGFLLTQASIDWYREQYAAPDPMDPLASPAHADLAGLPPALVVTAGFDPLRDEGEAHCDRLRAAGVAVEHLDEADLVHGYLHMDGVLRSADRAVSRVTAAVKRWSSSAQG